MQSTVFALVFMVVLGGCGGTQFQGALDDSTLPDAGFPVPEVDSPSTPLEGGADMRTGDSASGSVEASADAAPSEDAAIRPDGVFPEGDSGGYLPEAGADGAASADAGPSDGATEPWCPESELFPAYSVTCDTWGQSHGWTLPGCCLPDHTCGTAYGTPRSCHR